MNITEAIAKVKADPTHVAYREIGEMMLYYFPLKDKVVAFRIERSTHYNNPNTVMETEYNAINVELVYSELWQVGKYDDIVETRKATLQATIDAEIKKQKDAAVKETKAP